MRIILLALTYLILITQVFAVQDADKNGALDLAVGGTNAKTAADARTSLGISGTNTPIVDAGGYFTSGNVEGALQELGSGGGSGTDDQKIDVFNLTGTTLNLSLESDGEATKTVNLSSLQDGTGTDDQTASEVNITDAGGYYTGSTVEAALQELGVINNPATQAFKNVMDYGAYCDGSSHVIADVSAYTLPNGSHLYEYTWSSGANYLQEDRVLGSDGRIYVAIISHGVTTPSDGSTSAGAVNPVTDTNHSRWWPIFSDGDQADFIAAQYLAGEKSFQLPFGHCIALDDTKPLVFYKPGIIMQGMGAATTDPDILFAQFTATMERSWPESGTVISGWGATPAADAILVAATGVQLRDFRMFGDQLTTTNYWAINFEAQEQYANHTYTGVDYNYALLAKAENLIIEQFYNAVRFGKGCAVGEISNIFVRDNYGTGLEEDIVQGSGDLDVRKFQIRNNIDVSDPNEETIGVKLIRGEQISLHEFKTWGVMYGIYIEAPTHLKNIYLFDPSIEHVAKHAIYDGATGTENYGSYIAPAATRLWVYGGKLSQIIGTTPAIVTAYGDEPPCVELDSLKFATFIGTDFYACTGPGAYLDIEDIIISGSHFGRLGMPYDFDNTTGTFLYTEADRVTASEWTDALVIGPNATNVKIEGSNFDDYIYDTLRNYITIESGASNYIITGNTFGTLAPTPGGTSIVDGSGDAASFIQFNTCEENDCITLGTVSSSVSSIATADTSVAATDTGTGKITFNLDSGGSPTGKLEIEAISGGAAHTKMTTGSDTNRLSIVAAASGEYIPRLQIIPDNDVATAVRGWANFDYGSQGGALVFTPRFNARYTEDGINFTEMISARGDIGVVLRAEPVAVADGDIEASNYTVWMDESNNELEFKWRDSGGTMRSGTLGAGTGGSGPPTNITTPSAGQLLIYDGTDTWDNKTLGGDATLASNGALTIAADSVALGADTTGNYVSSATIGGGLVLSGTEGGSLGLTTSCGTGSILKWNGSVWACAADDGGTGSGTVSSGTAGQFAYYNTSGTSVLGRNITLGTDTAGNYVSSATSGGGLALTGTEGASLGLLTSCGLNQILKWSGTAWDCAADIAGGSMTTGDSSITITDSGTGVIANTVDSRSIMKLSASTYGASLTHAKWFTGLATDRLSLIAGDASSSNFPRFQLLGGSDTGQPGSVAIDYGWTTSDLNSTFEVRYNDTTTAGNNFIIRAYKDEAVYFFTSDTFGTGSPLVVTPTSVAVVGDFTATASAGEFSINGDTGEMTIGGMANSYTGGSAYLCISSSGAVFASESGCP